MLQITAVIRGIGSVRRTGTERRSGKGSGKGTEKRRGKRTGNESVKGKRIGSVSGNESGKRNENGRKKRTGNELLAGKIQCTNMSVGGFTDPERAPMHDDVYEAPSEH